MGEGSLHPHPEGWGIRDPPHSRCNKEHIIELIPSRVIEPAEKMCRERQDKLDQLFKS